MSGDGFTVWVTGPDAAACATVADDVAARLRSRHVAVESLDERMPGAAALGDDARRMAVVAGALARHGIASVVSLAAPRRAEREAARTNLGRMIEVLVRPATGAWLDYEPPDRPEVEIILPEPVPGVGLEHVLTTLEVLGHLGRAEDTAYSAEEEREVIKRLKAFGYL
jgi:hypothetical protein